MKKLNVGIIGAGTMCRAHSLGYAAMPMHFPDASAVPVRKVLCDINDELARQGAERYGGKNRCPIGVSLLPGLISMLSMWSFRMTFILIFALRLPKTAR